MAPFFLISAANICYPRLENIMTDTQSDDISDITSPPTTIAYNDETVIWQGGPSQLLNSWNFLCCSLAIVFTLYCLWVWHTELYVGYERLSAIINAVAESVILGCALAILYFYLVIKSERTTITKNKIQEEKGITRLFKEVKFCEISDIRDIKSPPPGLLLGLFKLSNLVIETNDDDQPIIVIRAIRDRSDVVQKLQPLRRELKIERKGYFSN